MSFFDRFLQSPKKVALNLAKREAEKCDDIQRKLGLSEEKIKELNRELGDGGTFWAEMATIEIMRKCGISRDEARSIAFETVSNFYADRYAR